MIVKNLISIIVPVYNVERYIDECLDSLIRQSASNIEIIVINDGSTDNSEYLVRKKMETDSRIFLYNKINGGLSSARNYGLSKSKGEYIGFVDSDDYIDANMYKILYDNLKQHNCDIAMCGRVDVFHDKNIKKFYNKKIELWDKKRIPNIMISKGMDNSVCNKLFKRDVIGDILFPVGKYYEDVYFTPKVFYQSNLVVHVGDALYYYRRTNETSITSNTSVDKMYDWLENSKSNFLISKEKNWISCSKKAYFLALLNLCMILKKNKEYRQSKEYKELRSLFWKIIFSRLPITSKVKVILCL